MKNSTGVSNSSRPPPPHSEDFRSRPWFNALRPVKWRVKNVRLKQELGERGFRDQAYRMYFLDHVTCVQQSSKNLSSDICKF